MIQKYGKRIVKILNSLLNAAILCTFLLFVIYGGFIFWQTNQVYQSADAKEYAMYSPSTEDGGLSFAALQEINPDVFAWLNVYGTNIDYPVAQTADNKTYLNTNVLGEYSISGSLFMDCDNAPDFSDFSSIIYGHHMDKDAMFGGLNQFKDPAFLTAHQYGSLYFNGKEHGLEFFAFLEVDAYDSTIYTPVVGSGKETAYISNLIEKSVHSRDISITAEDHIVLLSTCTADATNGRHILAGKLTDTLYPDTFGGDEEKTSARTVKPQITHVLGIPLWYLAIPSILIILIILYLICVWRERKKDR